MDKGKMREFAELVNGAERYARPYKIALVVSNALWASIAIAVLLGGGKDGVP
jgi:hypothetical protein